jgi:hypothetical protein
MEPMPTGGLPCMKHVVSVARSPPHPGTQTPAPNGEPATGTLRPARTAKMSGLATQNEGLGIAGPMKLEKMPPDPLELKARFILSQGEI